MFVNKMHGGHILRIAFGITALVLLASSAGATAFNYDRQGAYNYAEKYWNKSVSDGYFWNGPLSSDIIAIPAGTDINNPLYQNGDDCAHFVSSTIGSESHERGGGLDVPSRVPPTYGEPGAGRLGQWLIDNGLGVVVSDVSQLEMGDVINYNWSGSSNNPTWDHIALYLGNGNIASHTSFKWNSPWNMSRPNANHRFIHILASNAVGRSGGPDYFGYTFKDSNVLGGPIYNWIEITGTGTSILANSDDTSSATIPISFFFNYYGNDYSNVRINVNGIIFAGTTTSQYVNTPIGTSPPFNKILVVSKDRLKFSSD